MRVFLVAAAFCASAIAARADVVYTYTGHDFDIVYGGYTTSDSVTGSFTLAAPLGDNHMSSTLFQPESFSFSDGLQTLDNSNASFAGFIQTDGSGQITDYTVELVSLVDPADYYIYLFNNPLNNGDMALDGLSNEAYAPPSSFGVSTTSPASATPEPSSLMLLGSGIVGLAGLARRRFR